MRLLATVVLMAAAASSACACSGPKAAAKPKPVWIVVDKAGNITENGRPTTLAAIKSQISQAPAGKQVAHGAAQ